MTQLSDPPHDATAAPRRTMRGRSSSDTRSAVLDLIRASGEISRVDLARRSALTEATISKIVKELLATGLVVQAGYAQSTGGKRAELLRLNGGGIRAIGMTLDFNRSVVVLCGADGGELARVEAPGTGFDDPAVALERLAAAVETLLEREGVDRESVVGACVAVAGRRGSPMGGVVDTSFFDAWEPYPVASELQRMLGLPVLRENDANCAALGEFWSSKEPARDFVAVYMSSGIGAGIVIDGAIYHGASGNAGEIGHVTVEPDGVDCWCGSRGCLETVASPRAIVRAVRADEGLCERLDVDAATPNPEVYRRFTALAEEGEPRAAAILGRATETFAAAVGALVNTLDLDLVVLAGSGFAGTEEAFLGAVRRRVERTAFMRELHPISVRLASAGSGTAALGAASVVLHRHLTPHRSA
ncbi:ROK family transcriptional regulator [Amnibacterium endophyticum]|uniref:ROK family transcriptional regulator n=1 Tax=Amnibacterium endophyticum TaxID=2109337 RepID=A0ABW4LEA5_9MICO